MDHIKLIKPSNKNRFNKLLLVLKHKKKTQIKKMEN